MHELADRARLAWLGESAFYRRMVDGLLVADVIEDRHMRFLSRYGKVHHFKRENAYLVTGFEEVDYALKNDALFLKMRQTALDPYGHFIYAKPERHAQTDALVRACLTKRIFNDSAQWIWDLSVRVFDSLPVVKKFDWSASYAMPVVYHSTCHLFGFDPGESEGYFREGGGNLEDPGFYLRFKPWCLQALAADHMPGDERMLNAFRRYVDQGDFTPDEAAELMLVMFAGALKTTASFLCILSRELMTRSTILGSLVSTDDQGLTRFMEESLRLNPIVPRIMRKVVSETILSGVHLQEGSWVYLDVRAANRDADRFGKSDSVSLTNHHQRHLTFGAGIHQCVGMGMARHVLKTVVSSLLGRIGAVDHLASKWVVDTEGHHFYHPHYMICRRRRVDSTIGRG